MSAQHSIIHLWKKHDCFDQTSFKTTVIWRTQSFSCLSMSGSIWTISYRSKNWTMKLVRFLPSPSITWVNACMGFSYIWGVCSAKGNHHRQEGLSFSPFLFSTVSYHLDISAWQGPHIQLAKRIWQYFAVYYLVPALEWSGAEYIELLEEWIPLLPVSTHLKMGALWRST